MAPAELIARLWWFLGGSAAVVIGLLGIIFGMLRSQLNQHTSNLESFQHEVSEVFSRKADHENLERRVSILASKLESQEQRMVMELEKMAQRIEKKMDTNETRKERALDSLSDKFSKLRLRVEVAMARAGMKIEPIDE